MKKIITTLLIIISTLVLTGCQKPCEKLDEGSCKKDQRCLNRYKPCDLSDPGCGKDNTMFIGCITKKSRD